MKVTSRNALLKPIVFLLCLLPVAKLVYYGFEGRLGANPIERITHRTGWWTLAFLLIALAVTPARKITGQLWLIQYRRMLGLFAFFYGCLHMLTYVWLDQFFDIHAMIRDVAKRPFITMGSLAFVLMVPLAITSTKGWIRRLGKRWQILHRLVYISALAGVVHFVWLVKKDIREPILFGAILGILLLARVALQFAGQTKAKTVAVPATE